MESGTPTIWTPKRKWVGNFAPLPFLIVPAIPAAAFLFRGEFLVGGGLLAVAVVTGWTGLNLFGGTGSRAMRLDLARLLTARGEKIDGETPFVGFATPRFRSLLDAHQDVGFVFLDPQEFRFRSETRHVRMPRAKIERVGLAPNLHSMVGLGRWATVEGHDGGLPFRLFFEPRTESSMWRNRRRAATLRDRIESWRKGR